MTDTEPGTDGTQWLSYGGIVRIRGSDRASAIRMVRRKRWPKQDGNDGQTRVAVPNRFLRAKSLKCIAPEPVVEIGDQQDASGPFSNIEQDSSPTIQALSARIGTLREQLNLAQETATEREEQLRREMETATTRLHNMQAQLAEARLQATAFKATLDLQKKPFWHRWFG